MAVFALVWLVVVVGLCLMAVRALWSGLLWLLGRRESTKNRIRFD
jgi:hypothetical protein